jgi:prohibitin 1
MDRLLNRIMVGAVTTGAALAALSSCVYTVDGGQRAIIFDRIKGVKDVVVGEGMHIKVPILQKPWIYDVRTTPRNIRSETGSKDLQTVNVSLRVLFRPDEAKLPQTFSKYGLDYDERILPSVGNEVLKAVVAQYDAGELITQREHVSREIRDALRERATEFGIILEDVSITHLSFSQEFTSAIEHKQVAQQEAERSKFIVLKNEQEKKAAIIRAEGEAEAAKLISEAMKLGPGFIELRTIEASREIAETLAKSKNITYLPRGANVFIGTPPKP